jgi:pimeloyl-ACP methyl ester carboxylesterase
MSAHPTETACYVDVMEPETRYARSDDVTIAYQVIGDGPLDLVVVPGWVSHLEEAWRDPVYRQFMQRLASFTRLIRIDRRGTGLSDRVPSHATLEQRMDDVRAVMDAVGSEKAALLGISEGGPMCTLFAATYPGRTEALILASTMASGVRSEDYPWAMSLEQHEKFLDVVEENWGTGFSAALFAPSTTGDEQAVSNWARLERNAVSPRGARELFAMLANTDVRHVLPTVSVPTLVLHCKGDRATHVGGGRYIGEQIPGARYVEFESADHVPWHGRNSDSFLGEIEEFLTGTRGVSEPDRVLKTVMFSDIVDSTLRAVELGDRAWGELLEQFHDMVRASLATWRGDEIDTAGDGFFAAFDGPARAVRCACAVRDALSRRGIPVRVGLHTGECELIGGKIGGVAVHTGARVATQADPEEVLVSNTVRDLVAGSGLVFEDRGLHLLKGLPGEWQLFSAAA